MVHGYGVFTISKDEYYRGNWVNNSPEGYGEYVS